MFRRAPKADYIAFNIELVKAVEQHPCLYDYNRKEYCNREYVQNTWEEIAKQFNCTGKIDFFIMFNGCISLKILIGSF